MVNIQTILASNNQLESGLNLPNSVGSSGLNFVFAGATAGIGLSTLKAFAKHTFGTNAPRATAYIIGRSRAKFQPHLDELARINPQGRWIFLEGQLTLLKEGKRLAEEIIRLENERGKGQGGPKIDALILSTGYLTFNGQREDTEEGIDADHALQYYTRLLLTQMLLPLLSHSPHGRVVTIFSAGNEGAFTASDVSSEFRTGFSRLGSTFKLSGLTTTSLEVLAKEYPNVAFVHSYPGGVKTEILDKLMGTATGWYAYPAFIVKNYLSPLFWLVSRPFLIAIEESGERHLFLATSGAYPSANVVAKGRDADAETARGVVPLVAGLEVKKGEVQGVYRTQANCELVADNKTLQELRKQGLDRLGWRETLKTYERVLGEGAIREW